MPDAIFGTASPGISIAVTATASTAVLLPLTGIEGVKQGAVQLRVVNEGPSAAFIATGALSTTTATLPTTTATKTCDAVLAGADVTLTLAPDALYISAICRAAGTATLTVYAGKGQ